MTRFARSLLSIPLFAALLLVSSVAIGKDDPKARLIKFVKESVMFEKSEGYKRIMEFQREEFKKIGIDIDNPPSPFSSDPKVREKVNQMRKKLKEITPEVMARTAQEMEKILKKCGFTSQEEFDAVEAKFAKDPEVQKAKEKAAKKLMESNMEEMKKALEKQRK